MGVARFEEEFSLLFPKDRCGVRRKEKKLRKKRAKRCEKPPKQQQQPKKKKIKAQSWEESGVICLEQNTFEAWSKWSVDFKKKNEVAWKTKSQKRKKKRLHLTFHFLYMMSLWQSTHAITKRDLLYILQYGLSLKPKALIICHDPWALKLNQSTRLCKNIAKIVSLEFSIHQSSMVYAMFKLQEDQKRNNNII